MIFEGKDTYNFIGPETDYKWKKSSILDFNYALQLKWPKFVQTSKTEWMVFMGQVSGENYRGSNSVLKIDTKSETIE